MSNKYILHFVQDHVTFRWMEFESLAEKHNLQYTSIENHTNISPLVVIKVDNNNTQKLIDTVQNSFLLRGCYEFWGKSSTLEELVKIVEGCKHLKKAANKGFRIECKGINIKISHSTKVEWIEKLTFIDHMDATIRLTNPDEVFHLLYYCEPNSTKPGVYYFARQISLTNKSVISKFNLKARKFIANTTMDPLLSFVIANIAKICPNQLVYDPFVGSGGLLISAAYLGAYVFGSDIDYLLIHARSKPSRIGQKVREADESFRANFEQYSLQSQYLDIIVGDVSRNFLKQNFKVDAIITDPPYGVRESSVKVGDKSKPATSEDAVHYPSKTNYTMPDLLKDLLSLAAEHLHINGRLVYFLPVTKNSDNMEKLLPSHPSLKFVTYCEQSLTPSLSRLLVIMEKVNEHNDIEQDKVTIPESLLSMNFRDSYFSGR